MMPSMIYQLRPVTSKQQTIWDTFVTQHPRGHLLQCWDWGELKALSGWSPLRLALWQGDTIVAAAQVLRRGAPHVPQALAHLAYIPKGPVLDWTDQERSEFFLTSLNAYLRRHGALALRLDLPHIAGIPEAQLVVAQLKRFHAIPIQAIQPLRSIVLDLAPDEQTLLAQMKEKWRYNVRLAMRKGITIRAATATDDVRAWYNIYQTTSERDQFGIHSLDYYLRVWELFGTTGRIRLFLAEHNGRLLAGIFVALCAGEAIYMYGASNNEQRQLMPNYLLQWEAIRWAKQVGAHRYDFWGIPATDNDGEAMAGVYRFKRGWGGQIVQYLGGYGIVYRRLLMRIARQWV
jgi:peptidoglycan pentaglycine glycine transferase (the first glycine)